MDLRKGENKVAYKYDGIIEMRNGRKMEKISNSEHGFNEMRTKIERSLKEIINHIEEILLRKIT
jgi:hypothetical protein